MSTTTGLHRNFKDARGSAQHVFDAISGGGIAIFPVYAGYGVFGASDAALDKIYRAKQRGPQKLYTLLGHHDLHRDVHEIDPDLAGLVDRVTGELDFALGVVAPLRLDHPLIRRITPAAMARANRDGRINILLNSGELMEKLAEMSVEARLPVFGTSANLSGRGLKGRVADIEAPVLEAANLVIDEGDLPGYSSTILDFTARQTIRYGHRYEDVRRIANGEFGLDLPAASVSP